MWAVAFEDYSEGFLGKQNDQKENVKFVQS